jgi:hypothetical protein
MDNALYLLGIGPGAVDTLAAAVNLANACADLGIAITADDALDAAGAILDPTA